VRTSSLSRAASCQEEEHVLGRQGHHAVAASSHIRHPLEERGGEEGEEREKKQGC